MKKILYVGWLGFDNLGDELMYDVFKEVCDQYFNPGSVTIPYIPMKKTYNVKDYDVVVLGGGSLLLQSYYINILYQAVQLKKKVIIWGTGTDRLPKYSLKTLLDKNDKKSDYIPEKDRRRLKRIIQHASYVGVRGPLTYNLLKKMDLLTPKVKISGDPGFLLSRNLGGQKKDKKNVKKTIGINWGTTFNNIYGSNEAHVEDEMVKVARDFIQKGYRIYIYSMWSEDIEPCKRLYNKLNDKQHVTLSTRILNQNQLMDVLKNFSFTINFKLHANIISYAANTPFIAIGYRFKIYDFAHSIGLPNLVVDTESKMLKQDILRIEQYIHENRKDIVSRFETTRKDYEYKLLNSLPLL